MIPVLGYPVLAALCSTLRWRVEGQEHLAAVAAAGRQPILAFWHGRILPATHFFRDRGIVVITSENFDGEWIAGIIRRFGYGTARGSTSKGGARALLQMSRELSHGHPVAFTVDGPRGPARVPQPGAVWLAKASGHPVVPFHCETAPCWTLGSWDRTQIPRPFARGAMAIGEPLYVPREADAAVRNAGKVEGAVGIANVHHYFDRQWRQSVEFDLLLIEVEHAVVDESGVTFGTGDRDGLALGDYAGRVSAADHRRNAEFAGDDGGMTGAPAAVGDDRRGAFHHRLPVRIGHVGDQHVARLHARHLRGIGDERCEACAFETVRPRQMAQFHERREEIDLRRAHVRVRAVDPRQQRRSATRENVQHAHLGLFAHNGHSRAPWCGGHAR